MNVSVGPASGKSVSAARPIRVLHVLGSMNPGGVETWLMNLLRHLEPSKFEFHFCTFGPQPGAYAHDVEELGGKIIPCPMKENTWRHGGRFRRILRDGRYDVVHSHVYLFSGAVLRWAHAEGVPMRIAHSHTTNDGKKLTPARKLYRWTMKRWIERHATHRLAASQEAEVALLGNGLPGHERHVLYYGIDLRPFNVPVNREEVRREFSIPGSARVVGHVGRFVTAKNHRFLLEIAKETIARRRDVHFLLVGDGLLRAEIEARAKALGVSDAVHFAGARHDVARLLQGTMDIFLLPSLWEGLGISCLEAQAAGLPCVTSDAVPREAVVCAQNVERLPLSAAASCWADRILFRLNQPQPDRTAALRQVAASAFSIERSAAALAQIYQQSPGQRSRVAAGVGD